MPRNPLFDFDLPPLSSEDQRLVEEYGRTGRAVDDLPYTSEFLAMCQALGVADNDAARHDVFRRVVNLRKQGRLPRFFYPRPAGRPRQDNPVTT
jgi:hypothetical protein